VKLRLAAIALLPVAMLIFPPQGVSAATPQVTLHPCTDPNYTTSDPSGGVAYGNKNVNADVWDDINDTFTLSACAANSWNTTSSAGDGQDQGAVQAYYDTMEDFADPTVASLPDFVSNFGYSTSTCGTQEQWEAAYDIWLGDANTWTDVFSHTEMMIWSIDCNQQQALLDNFGAPVATDVPIDGYDFDVYESGNFTDGNGVFLIYVNDATVTSGQYDLSDFFGDAASRGYLYDGTSTDLWAVDDGFEYCWGRNVTLDLEAFSAKSIS
jgi:hypothetical protein